MATIINVEQRTPEWFKARLGRLTGSRAKDMLATIKTGEAAARRDYRADLVCERLTGEMDDDGYVSKEMQRGTDLEPAAFAAYQIHSGNLCRRTGFVQLDDLMAGCSLDGDTDDMTGIIELKVPKKATHLKYLRAKSVPSDHLAQVTHNLWVTGAQWCDFVSFDPRFPEHLQLFVVRVARKDVDLKGYEAKALAFLAEVDAEVRELQAMEAA